MLVDNILVNCLRVLVDNILVDCLHVLVDNILVNCLRMLVVLNPLQSTDCHKTVSHHAVKTIPGSFPFSAANHRPTVWH